jgi:hypothetical protein
MDFDPVVQPHKKSGGNSSSGDKKVVMIQFLDPVPLCVAQPTWSQSGHKTNFSPPAEK